MGEEKETADRLTTYSGADFAVIVTVMVLELEAPERAALSALWPLWPTAISYAVSYLILHLRPEVPDGRLLRSFRRKAKPGQASQIDDDVANRL
jgi:hypothetical protein